MSTFEPGEELAREFKADPLGHHSPNLMALLRRFRSEPVPGKYALLRTKPERAWTVVEFSGVKGVPLKLHPGLTFTDWRAAEWAAFQLRWRRHVGRPLSAAASCRQPDANGQGALDSRKPVGAPWPCPVGGGDTIRPPKTHQRRS